MISFLPLVSDGTSSSAIRTKEKWAGKSADSLYVNNFLYRFAYRNGISR